MAPGCRSLGIFTEHSVVRRFCMRAITNVYFEGFVLLLVLLSSVLLALDTPSLDDSSRLAQVISVCDIIFVACFTLEMCLKVNGAFRAATSVKSDAYYSKHVPCIHEMLWYCRWLTSLQLHISRPVTCMQGH